MPIKVICVAGARPNFMKIAPIMRALRSRPLFDSFRTPPVSTLWDGRSAERVADELERIFAR
jgi:hypothetical protein